MPRAVRRAQGTTSPQRCNSSERAVLSRPPSLPPAHGRTRPSCFRPLLEPSWQSIQRLSRRVRGSPKLTSTAGPPRENRQRRRTETPLEQRLHPGEIGALLSRAATVPRTQTRSRAVAADPIWKLAAGRGHGAPMRRGVRRRERKGQAGSQRRRTRQTAHGHTAGGRSLTIGRPPAFAIGGHLSSIREAPRPSPPWERRQSQPHYRRRQQEAEEAAGTGLAWCFR